MKFYEWINRYNFNLSTTTNERDGMSTIDITYKEDEKLKNLSVLKVILTQIKFIQGNLRYYWLIKKKMNKN